MQNEQTEKPVKIIHKKVISTGSGDRHAYQMCEPEKISTNRMNQAEIEKWLHRTSHRWENVNCPECLKKKGLRTDQIKKRRRNVSPWMEN